MNIRKIVRVTLSASAIVTGATYSQLQAEEGAFVSLPKNVSNIELYGDARFRFQYEDVEDKDGRSRWRYRARLGANVKFDNPAYSMGFRLETGEANDSTNANFGGYFDKVGDELFLGLVFMKYTADDWDLTIGKHKQPFTIQKAWWDGDINPEGLSETFAVGDVTVKLGQYIIDEEDERKASGGDDFLFVAQAEWKTDNLTLSPFTMVSTGGSSTSSETGTFSGENSNTVLGDFFVVALPFEYKVSSGKFFGTWGVNLNGDDLMTTPDTVYYSGNLDNSSQNQFFNIGYQHGSAKKEGQSQFGIEYRFIEAGAYTPNLSDSDFAKNHTNQEGFVAHYKHMFTDFFAGQVTVIMSDPIDSGYTANVSDSATIKILQVDASIKF